MPQYTAAEIEMMAYGLMGEGSSVETMTAVANVVRNRAESPVFSRDGNAYDVFTHPGWFSTFNAESDGGNQERVRARVAAGGLDAQAFEVAQQIVRTVIVADTRPPDPTGRSVYYTTRNAPTPYWADDARTSYGTITDGAHLYYAQAPQETSFGAAAAAINTTFSAPIPINRPTGPVMGSVTPVARPGIIDITAGGTVGGGYAIRATPFTTPRSEPITSIVMHHTAGSTLGSALSAAGRTGSTYYIDRDGSIYQYAADGSRVVNVRVSGDPFRTDRGSYSEFINNDNTIGIEIVGAAGGADDITAAQIAAAGQLGAWLASEYGIDPAAIVGHGQLQGGAGGNRLSWEGVRAAQAAREAMGGSQFAYFEHPEATPATIGSAGYWGVQPVEDQIAITPVLEWDESNPDASFVMLSDNAPQMDAFYDPDRGTFVLTEDVNTTIDANVDLSAIDFAMAAAGSRQSIDPADFYVGILPIRSDIVIRRGAAAVAAAAGMQTTITGRPEAPVGSLPGNYPVVTGRPEAPISANNRGYVPMVTGRPEVIPPNNRGYVPMVTSRPEAPIGSMPQGYVPLVAGRPEAPLGGMPAAPDDSIVPRLPENFDRPEGFSPAELRRIAAARIPMDQSAVTARATILDSGFGSLLGIGPLPAQLNPHPTTITGRPEAPVGSLPAALFQTPYGGRPAAPVGAIQRTPSQRIDAAVNANRAGTYVSEDHPISNRPVIIRGAPPPTPPASSSSIIERSTTSQTVRSTVGQAASSSQPVSLYNPIIRRPSIETGVRTVTVGAGGTIRSSPVAGTVAMPRTYIPSIVTSVPAPAPRPVPVVNAVRPAVIAPNTTPRPRVAAIGAAAVGAPVARPLGTPTVVLASQNAPASLGNPVLRDPALMAPPAAPVVAPVVPVVPAPPPVIVPPKPVPRRVVRAPAPVRRVVRVVQPAFTTYRIWDNRTRQMTNLRVPAGTRVGVAAGIVYTRNADGTYTKAGVDPRYAGMSSADRYAAINAQHNMGAGGYTSSGESRTTPSGESWAASFGDP